ncbi:MAG: hypothetical protein WKG07_31930 [Hymenobacter sp.]
MSRFASSSFHEQMDRNLAEKRRIGLKAPPSSSPAKSFRSRPAPPPQGNPQPAAEANVTVVTNTVNVAMELSQRDDVRVFVAGGFLTGSWFWLVERPAQALSQFFVDKVFIGVNGIDAQRAYLAAPEEAAVIQVMLRQASGASASARPHQAQRNGFALICPTVEIHQLITDSGRYGGAARAFFGRWR